MRAVIQRVRSASVQVDGQVVGSIGRGLLVLLGVGQGDSEADAALLADKLAGLRIFEDDQGKMNLAPADVGAEFLVVSQFTLYGDIRKGRRPSFTGAASPDHARALYERCKDLLRARGFNVESGVFGARMLVQLENDGPVTLWFDTAEGLK
ncbi:MAG: D-tyrosyl-tRNA(Tyr) deacylase [Firmicutes bacterium ZCTH02-B6]|nr:MAG: D-tyrosyl-tRNA(Tyr) deacylase [Firmicutes bacterium ZCTH02-B6]